MITTTNKQILSVEFAKKFKEQAEYDKAVMRIGAKKNQNQFIAKSANFALFSTEHFGIYLLDAEDINEVMTPLTANERKALDFCFKPENSEDREASYCAELKRLRSLPIQSKKIIIEGFESSIEYVLNRTCDRWDRAEDEVLPIYFIEFNEDFSLIEREFKQFGIKYKEA